MIMIGFLGCRFFHTCRPQFSVGKSSLLGKLRKSTGYSVSNCKKALENFPDDITKAEEWLHAQAKQQGWSKWAKMQTRSATQGLIGVFSKDKIGVMVEVNCETDFVAKNLEFHQLVENIILGCVNHLSGSPITTNVTKTVLDESHLNEIKHNSSTLGELVNAAVFKFNEKTVLKRAICLNVKEDIHLSALSHPTISCPSLPGATLGRYGTLLAYKYDEEENSPDKDLSLNICQHIIGMNPTSIGQLTEQDILNFSREVKPEESVEIKETEKSNVECNNPSESVNQSSIDPIDYEIEGQDTVTEDLKETNETQLVFQPFLLDNTITVGETLFKSGIDVIDFERFECGENLDDVDSKEAVNAKM